MNNGGIRADLQAGQATYGSLFEIHPFANVLYRLTVRGRDLRAYLERLIGRDELNAHVSGVTIVYRARQATGLPDRSRRRWRMAARYVTMGRTRWCSRTFSWRAAMGWGSRARQSRPSRSAFQTSTPSYATYNRDRSRCDILSSHASRRRFPDLLGLHMRVYVNATGLDLPAGSTALDAVRAWNVAAADDVARRAQRDRRQSRPSHGSRRAAPRRCDLPRVAGASSARRRRA